MSRVGKKPISVPDKVEVKVDGNDITVKGPKGELSWAKPTGIEVSHEDGQLTFSSEPTRDKTLKAMFGTSRALVANMIEGVNDGFVKELEILGVGFRAKVQGSALDLNLGFSHPVLHPIPEGLTVTVTDNTKIKVEGIDKQLVGQFASDVRDYYPPEPYKGKGIRYKGEHVRRKQGKSVK